MLILARKPGEGVSIGDIKFKVNGINQDSADLEINAHLEQTIRIGENVRLMITQLEEDQVKIGISAPRWMKISRDELNISSGKYPRSRFQY